MPTEFDRELDAPPAQRWEHDPNPLVGELVARYTFEGDYDPAEMLVIQPEGAERAFSVLCGRAVLRSFIERRDPQVGGRVGLKYLGETQGRSGNTYPDYNTAYEAPQMKFEAAPEEGGDDTDGLPF